MLFHARCSTVCLLMHRAIDRLPVSYFVLDLLEFMYLADNLLRSAHANPRTARGKALGQVPALLRRLQVQLNR